MWAILFFFLLISSGSALCCAIFQKKYEDVLPITCSGIVLILFLFGIFGYLKTGVVVSCLLGIGFYIAAIFWILKHKTIRAWLENFFSSGFFTFLIWSVILIFALYGKVLHSWDEFSHWGDIVKVMVYIDDFGTNPMSGSMFPSYPPGMGLFQYMLQKINLWISGGTFSEWLLYVAYHMFAFSFLVPFIKGKGKKGIFYAILAVGILFLVPTMFYEEYYTTLYIDPFLGIVSGAGIARILLCQEKDIFYSLYIVSACSMLVLAKDAGMLFAIVLGCTYLAAMFMDTKKYSRKTILNAVLIIMAILLPKVLWTVEVWRCGAKKVFDAPVDLWQLTDILLNKDETYKNTVWHTFWKNFATSRIEIGNTGIGISSLFLLLIAILFIYILFKWGVKKGILEKRKSRLVFWIVVLQAVIYVVGLAITYIFKFTEYEATRLASYERYINVLHLSIWIIIVLSLINMIYNIVKMSKKVCVYASCMYLIAIVPLAILIILNIKDMVFISKDVRKEYQETVDAITQYTKESEKIYVISQEDNGYNRLVLKYLLRPNTINDTGYSIGESFYEGDIWTINKSSEEWMYELCAKYDYVLLYEINDYFIETYSKLFDKQEVLEKDLYQINKKTRTLETVE